MDLETFPQSATPNHRKSKKCRQSMLQEGPQIHSKAIKNGHLGINVTLDPRTTKMVSQGLKKELRGVQNSRFR